MVNVGLTVLLLTAANLLSPIVVSAVQDAFNDPEQDQTTKESPYENDLGILNEAVSHPNQEWYGGSETTTNDEITGEKETSLTTEETLNESTLHKDKESAFKDKNEQKTDSETSGKGDAKEEATITEVMPVEPVVHKDVESGTDVENEQNTDSETSDKDGAKQQATFVIEVMPAEPTLNKDIESGSHFVNQQNTDSKTSDKVGVQEEAPFVEVAMSTEPTLHEDVEYITDLENEQIMNSETLDKVGAKEEDEEMPTEPALHKDMESGSHFKNGALSDNIDSQEETSLEEEEQSLLEEKSKNDHVYYDTSPAHESQENLKAESEAIPNLVLESLFKEDESIESLFSETTRKEVEPQIRSVSMNPDANKNSPASPTEGEQPLTPAMEKYVSGMSLINSTNSLTTIMRGYQLLQDAASLGNADAEVEIAFARLLGLHRPMDVQLAYTELKEHSDEGHPKAQAIIGFMHASGIGAPPSQGAAIVHWTMSATGHDEMGQMMLGYRLWSGFGVQKNCERALPYYKDVAYKVAAGVTMGGGLVIVKVRLQDEEDNSGQIQGLLDDDLLQYYQFLADKGDVAAQVTLGQLYYQGGRGVERDHSRAFDYFKRAADAGNGNAQAHIGKIYAEGADNVERDDEKAFAYFLGSAEQENPIGQASLGLFYKQGRAVTKDYTKAMEWLKLSSDQGWSEGQLHLGSMYFNGEGGKRDYKQAFQLYSVAAQNGHLLALFYLAEMHALGIGVSRSCSTAVELYKNVCERGHHTVLFEQAHSQYKAMRVDSAFAIYTLLAELGHEVAQNNAAFMLDRGIVTDNYMNQTDARALQLWTRSATQGYINARIKLGDYHYYGRGTAVDYEAAAAHYKTAGDVHKSPQAYFNLGYMHEQGLGFKRDIYLAKRHYDMAHEVSADAAAPVTIALAKITFLFILEALSEQGWWIALTNFSFPSTLFTLPQMPSFTSLAGSYWDLYVILALVTLLVYFVKFLLQRRQRLNQRNR